ncbi:expressed unknown protein [Ectocarpus siliculosus]|uniref:Uncharacterized protein n=1 Tax=Ectocarpus siliculosus TaxID=2880 RepID=D7FR45_ECTSI|nr:expressed unknown protein [Ectocarpus siliculosus]|eukprot:CBJ26112.1 expressed unknown protein [Ectocarpus siliculosus]
MLAGAVRQCVIIVVTLWKQGEARGRRLVALLFTQVALSPSVVKRCRLNGFKA